MKTIKLVSLLLLVSGLAVLAETEERINKRFAIQPGGRLIVDVDFGTVDVATNATGEIVVDVLRGGKADETAFLAGRPVTFSQDGDTLTIHSRGKSRQGWSWFGRQRTEGKYTISVPARFNAHIKTSGGGITVSDLTGEVKAGTSGGGLEFTRLRGPLDGGTSGGGIRVADCQGELKIKSSGGGIQVSGGSGTLDGNTSGGSISVKDFRGPARVETGGGGITIENVAGMVEGSTSGGSISARFSSPLSDQVKLDTSGGGVTVRVPENSAFDLDAATSGGGVSSELPVTITGKPSRSRLKGPVNGGGKPVLLRTSGGNIQVKKL
jgi:hypothetical protein